MHNKIKGKTFTWYHFPQLEESDFKILEKKFKFHPLDFDDLRVEAELQKIDVYNDYIFAVFNLPRFNLSAQRVVKQTLAFFVGKDFIVTATREPIDAVNRFFTRANRSSGLKKEALDRTPGYFIYKFLDYLSRDSNVILKELVRETQIVEDKMYDGHTQQTTKRLGILRRNVLFFRHIIDPQRILIEQFVRTRKSYIPTSLDPYFDDVKDNLDESWVVTDNLKNIIEGLFNLNEALLSHRTNQIIRILTVISVILMPPTLIASYYGMNIQNLPLVESIESVTLVILISVILSWMLIAVIFRRK
ncbi:MAG: magnesium transporter CorA family protein [Patescibacteria group bacterium]